MRIAYYSDVFLPKIDGVVVSLLTLSSEMGKRGHTIAIFCPGPGRGKRITWSAKSVSVYSVPSVATFYPDLRVGAPSPRSLLQLRRFRADVVHLMGPGPLGMEGLLGAGILKLPAVHTFHAYFMEPEYLKLVRLSRFKRVSRALWRYVMVFSNRCDFVVAPTEFVARDLVAHGLTKPHKVVSNGVDFSLFQGIDSGRVRAVKTQFKLRDHVVLYVGRLSKEKNLEMLMQAFSKVHEYIPDSQLLLVGDGPLRSKLERIAMKLGVAQDVIFTGKVEHDRLLASGIFQAALVFCTPSTSETQGLSVVEAAAAGLPIVGVAARGVKELVDGNGVLVEVGDVSRFSEAIVSFLSSRRRRSVASKLSKKMARNHSIENVADSMEGIYSSLIS